jgi:hypothetical protein
MKTNKNILEEANDIIFNRKEEVNRQYGPFIESMKKSAKFASKLCGKKITTEDFFKCMIALKISRLSYNTKHDTILDAIGYLAGLDELYKLKANKLTIKHQYQDHVEKTKHELNKNIYTCDSFRGPVYEPCRNCGITFGKHLKNENKIQKPSFPKDR